MPVQIHNKNKYKKTTRISSNVVTFPKAKKYSPIKVKLSHSKNAILDFSWLSHRPLLEQFFYEIITLIGESVSGLTLRTK